MAANQVIHPSAEVLRAFALGKLNDSTASVVMNHLDSCPDCCKQVAALSWDPPAPSKTLGSARSLHSGQGGERWSPAKYARIAESSAWPASLKHRQQLSQDLRLRGLQSCCNGFEIGMYVFAARPPHHLTSQLLW
jgi:hypothetical protein